MLIGNIIEQEFSTSMNWNLGSGLSIALMIFVLISMMFTVKNDGGRRAAYGKAFFYEILFGTDHCVSVHSDCSAGGSLL